MTDTEDIRTELEKASALLSTASHLMQGGQLVSIASLERMVSLICSSIGEAGYGNCIPLKPSMAALLERIEKFGGEMQNHYGFLNGVERTEETDT